MLQLHGFVALDLEGVKDDSARVLYVPRRSKENESRAVDVDGGRGRDMGCGAPRVNEIPTLACCARIPRRELAVPEGGRQAGSVVPALFVHDSAIRPFLPWNYAAVS